MMVAECTRLLAVIANVADTAAAVAAAAVDDESTSVKGVSLPLPFLMAVLLPTSTSPQRSCLDCSMARSEVA